MLKPTLIALLAFAVVNQAIAEPATAEFKTEAAALAKRFAQTLKPQLQQALTEGGPVAAIAVCSHKAPEIARQLSAESGWQVKRVSLKPRNPAAEPEAWQRQVLLSFDQRAAAGEDPQTLSQVAQTESQLRFMKAQGVAPLCLTCHGSQLAPEVKTALDKYYPNDSARGYQPGQIRGAISIVAPRLSAQN
ncbi:Tll0287-like domain-containing protein [Shewanella algae]|uniref:Tll0287-like domain-containing protein n=1 Tax=Shewanella algae TaxID=38313 RepID=UPI001AAD867B|nr:DUF3365 domain-containing protein [Shewanella algae]MBO2563312.1 DUF3365 domain-containing protein [Shewanella algae]